jgi:hypothetical protein
MSNHNLEQKQKEILTEVLSLKKELDARKELYSRLDELLLELVRSDFKSAEIDGMVLTLKDNFAESNTGWTRSAVKRYEIETVTKELAAKREAKKAR